MPRRLSIAAAVGFYLALACAMTYPLVRFDRPVLPDSDDAYFSVWRIAWVTHQIARAPTQLFDANIFVPARNTLAYSDAMLALGVLSSPAIAFGAPPALVHNALVLGAFAASGWAAFLLCLELTGSRLAAILGGVIFAFAPFRFAHLGHLELLWTAPMPLAVLVLHRALTRARPLAHGVALGVLVTVQAFCSIYYAVFLVIFLAAWMAVALVLRRGAQIGPLLQIAVIAGIVTVVALAPYAYAYSRAREELGARALEEIRRFSATPADYLRVAQQSKTYPPRPGDAPDERSLFPGLLPVALALTALRRRDRSVVLYTALALFAFDCSLGLNGVSYRALSRVAPALDGLRAPARFSALFLLSLAALAALGLAALNARRPAWQRLTIATAAVTICVIEYWCVPITVRPAIIEPPAVYSWLNTNKSRAIVELPLPSASTLWLYESTYEYLSIFHWTPLVNGYSGHAPAAYLETLAVMQSFPSPESIARLRSLGVERVVVHERYYESASLDALIDQLLHSPDFAPPIRHADPVDPALVFPLAN